MSDKNLRSEFLKYVSATVASLTVFALYSMVDGLMVSWGVNEYAMSAVNLSLPVTNVLFSIAVMFAVGASTIIAIYLAQNKRKEADALFSQNVAVLLALGLVLSAGIFLLREPLGYLLGADQVTIGYVKDYLKGLAPFGAFFILSYNLEVLVKTDGHPRLALYTVITGALTNCVLDYVAIFWLDMGVFGAAVATGLSQALTTVIYLIHFFGKRCTFRLRKFKPNFPIYKKLLMLGFADSTNELCIGVMILLFNRVVQAHLGANGLVSYTVIAYVTTLICNLMMGVPQGAQPLISYHHGRRQHKDCRTLLRYGLITVGCLSVVVFAVLFVFAPQLVRFYLDDPSPQMVTDTVAAFRPYSVSYLLLGFNMMISGYMTARELPMQAMAISVGRGMAVQAGCLLVLSSLFGARGIWITPVLSESLVLVLSVAFLLAQTKKERKQLCTQGGKDK